MRDYLIQEIQVEGLVRYLPTFTRFVDSLAFSDGELVNYTNICRYHDRVLYLPYNKHAGRRVITSTPKFYLFDVGLSNILAKRSIAELREAEAGKALECYSGRVYLCFFLCSLKI